MKKIYSIIGVVVLITIVIALSMLKNNNVSTTTTTLKIYESSELFTQRDLEQNINTANATRYTVSDGKNINITSEEIMLYQALIKMLLFL